MRIPRMIRLVAAAAVHEGVMQATVRLIAAAEDLLKAEVTRVRDETVHLEVAIAEDAHRVEVAEVIVVVEEVVRLEKLEMYPTTQSVPLLPLRPETAAESVDGAEAGAVEKEAAAAAAAVVAARSIRPGAS